MMGRMAACRRARREAVKTYERMVEVNRRIGTEDYLAMRETFNSMPLRSRLRHSYHLMLGRM